MYALWILAAWACASPPSPVGGAIEDVQQHWTLGAAEVAARELVGLPPAEQIAAAFAYGEVVGETSDLSEIVRRARALPRGLEGAFMDGAAHTWSAPVGVPVEVIARQISRSVPERYQRVYHRGVLLSWTQAWSADPGRVVPAAQAYAAAAGELPLDGVRIGLQRALGDDLPAALARAARYPPAWQPALVEELGWRAGDTAGTWEGGLGPLMQAVPPAQRCAFVHGVARGRALRAPWTDERTGAAFGAQLTDRAGACAEAAWRGVAWALVLAWEHHPQQAHHYAGALPEVGRDSVLRHLRGLRVPARGAPWEGIPGPAEPGCAPTPGHPCTSAGPP